MMSSLTNETIQNPALFPSIAESRTLHPAFRGINTTCRVIESGRRLVTAIPTSRRRTQISALPMSFIGQDLKPTYRRPIGPRMTRDQKFLKTWDQRHMFWLEKFYAGRPFAFQARFWNKLFHRTLAPVRAYVEVFDRLKKDWLSKPVNKNLLAAHQRAEFKKFINKNKFNYSYLEIEDCPQSFDLGDTLFTFLDSETPDTIQVKPKVAPYSDEELIETFTTGFDINSVIFVQKITNEILHEEFKNKLKNFRIKATVMLQKIRDARHSSSSFNNIKTYRVKPYSKIYLNPRVNLVTSNPKYIDWAKKEYPNLYLKSSAAHQMDSQDIQCQQMGNVLLENQRKAATARTITRLAKAITSLSSADESIDSTAASDRFCIMETFEWTKDEAPGTVLKSYTLPAYLQQVNPSSANAVPLSISTFTNCDIEIEVMVNAQAYQLGQVMVAWLYDPDADKNISHRLNLQTLSQTTHCVVNASESNGGSLIIKYIHPMSSLPNIKSKEMPGCLNLGKLYFLVMNQLNCPTGVSPSATITWGIRLINRNFYGMRDRSVGEFSYPQMEAAAAMVAVSAAESLLHGRGNDAERDLPPYTGARPPMVPQSNQSFCVGDSAVVPINALRLDASGQHVHNTEGVDEMSVSFVASVPSFIGTMSWSKDDPHGKVLKRFDACPMWEPKEYVNYKKDNDNCYCLPAVAVVSSNFAYWSGELIFRFDFIKSFSHTGRILAAYVPFYLDDITLAQARNYPCEIFDLHESGQFVFKVPYISYMPLFPRRVGFTGPTDKTPPPGRVHLFVLHPLKVTDQIPGVIDINYYFAAGDSFEVYVPAQPSVGTSFFTDSSDPLKQTTAVSPPWYFGLDSSFTDDKGIEIAVCRSSVWASRVEHFTNTKAKAYYVMDAASKKNNAAIKVEFGLAPKVTYSIADLFYVPLDCGDGNGAIYFGACASEAAARRYFTDGPGGAGRQNCLYISLTGTSDYCNGNPIFDEYPVQFSSESFELISHHMEQTTIGSPDEEIHAKCSVYPSKKKMGKSFFGESFTSLKTLCRRYQPYGLSKISSTSTYGDAACSIPIVPQGMDVNINNKNSKFGKYIRDGTIPVILSGYRYFSGGMRMAFASSSANVTLWFQHRPDYEGDLSIKCPLSGQSADTIITTGYAMFLQSLKVNNIVSVEIPFYKNRNYVYLQRPDLRRIHISGSLHLGQLLVGIEGGKANEAFTLTSFYSLADDARACVFQGFPPMLILDNFQNSSLHAHKVNSILGQVHHQMNLDINGGVPVVMDIGPNLSASLDGLTTALTNVVPAVASITGNVQSALMDSLGHLGHCLITPTAPHILWSLTHFLLKIGMFKLENLSDIVPSLAPLVSYIPGVATTQPIEPLTPGEIVAAPGVGEAVNKFVTENPWAFCGRTDHPRFQAEEIVVSMDKIDTAISLLTLLFVGSSAMMSVSTIPPKPRGLFAMAAQLMKGIANASKGIRGITQFFKLIADLVVKVIQKVYDKTNRKKIFERCLTSELPMMSEWFVECKQLCDIKNEDQIFTRSSAWAEDVEEAYSVGVLLGQYLMDYYETSNDAKKASLGPIYAIYKDTFFDLQMKRNDMHKRGISSLARREPYSLWFSGPPGIGKSVFSQTVIPELLNAMGVSWRGESTFFISPAADFWNGCRNQPAVCVDDFLAVDGGTPRDKALIDYFSIKSPAILNPSMASLTDKELRYTPELFVLCSNASFPAPTIVNSEAFYRRRDDVVEVDLIDTITDAGFSKLTGYGDDFIINKKLAPLNTDIYQFGHLKFRFAHDPSSSQTKFSEWMTKEVFMEKLITRAKSYRRKQITLQSERAKNLSCRMNAEDTESPPSLRARRAEYKRAAQFIRDFAPRDHCSYETFFKITTDYSKDGFIFPEQMKDVIKLKHEILKELEDPKPNCLLDSHASCCIDKIVRISKLKPNVMVPWPDEIMSNVLIKLCMHVGITEVQSTTLEGDVSLRALEIAKTHVMPVGSKTTYDYSKEGSIHVRLFSSGTNLSLSFELLTIGIFRPDEEPDSPYKSMKPREYRYVFKWIGINCRHANNNATDVCTEARCYGDLARSAVFFNDPFCECYRLSVGHAYHEKKNTFLIFADNGKVTSIPMEGCDKPKCCLRDKDLRSEVLKNWGLGNREAVSSGNAPREVIELCTPKKKLYERIKETFTTLVEKLHLNDWDYYKNGLPKVAASVWSFVKIITPWVIAIGVTAGIAYYLFGQFGLGMISGNRLNNFCRNLPEYEDFEHQIGSSGDNAKSKGGVPKIAPSFFQVTKSQAGAEPTENFEALAKIIFKNSYFIIAPSGTKFRVTFIVENYMIYMKHYHEAVKHEYADPGWVMQNCYSGAKVRVYPQGWDINMRTESSLAYVRVTEMVYHRSIYKRFSAEVSHGRSKGYCYIVSPSLDYLQVIRVKAVLQNNLRVQGTSLISPQYLQAVYSYDWTGAGNCGSILVDPSLSQPILGVHVAGGSTVGHAEPVSCTQFSAWQVTDIEDPEEIIVREAPLSLRLAGEYVPIGKINDKLTHSESGKSREKPSLISGKVWDPISEPAPLVMGDPRMPENYSPLYSGVGNMLRPPKPFAHGLMTSAYNYMRGTFLVDCCPLVTPVRRRELDEVIVGIPGLKYFDGIEMTTSEGFPFSRYRPPGKRDKRWLFELEGNPQQVVGINKCLREMIVRELAYRKKGVRPYTIFDDCLKDMRLPSEKVTVEGKTRIFSTSPIQFTLVFKIYFQDFLVAFKQNRLQLSHAVGIAADGPEWTRLVHFLHRPFAGEGTKPKGYYLAGDYKNFGPSLSRSALHVVKKLILDWCSFYYLDYTSVEESEENNLVRSLLLDEVFDAWHLCRDNVYQPLCGAPSGSPITTEVNCMVNEIYLVVAFAELTGEPMDSFKRNVNLITYGDDLVMRVNEKYREIFNNITLSKFFASYDIGYTDATKIGTVKCVDSLTDLVFLKRKFKQHPKFDTQYLAPLDLKISVQECSNWMSSKIDPLIATSLSIEACLAGSYAHGQDTYRCNSKLLQDAAIVAGVSTTLRTWEEWDKIHFPHFYLPPTSGDDSNCLITGAGV